MKILIESITLYQIVQALVTLIVICAWVYMLVVGIEVNETLFNILMLVVGFFFGGVGGSLTNKGSK